MSRLVSIVDQGEGVIYPAGAKDHAESVEGQTFQDENMMASKVSLTGACSDVLLVGVKGGRFLLQGSHLDFDWHRTAKVWWQPRIVTLQHRRRRVL